MSTRETEDSFDYYRHTRENDPDPSAVRRGLESRRKRREAAKSKITIRIDDEVLSEFKGMVSGGRGYQALINRALREWLSAQGVKELIREELADVVKTAVAAGRE